MKKYLSKMSKKELEKVLLTHEEFLQFIYNNRMSCDIQDEMLEYINSLFCGNANKIYDVKDHYSSFYLILKNPEMLIESIDKDYLPDFLIELYEETKKIYNNYKDEKYEEKRNKLYDNFESKSKLLLDKIENILKDYETIPTKESIVEYIISNGLYEGCYYEDNKIKVDLRHTEEYK